MIRTTARCDTRRFRGLNRSSAQTLKASNSQVCWLIVQVFSLPVHQCSCATAEGPWSPAVHTCRCLSSKDSTMLLLHRLLLESAFRGKDPESNYTDGTMQVQSDKQVDTYLVNYNEIQFSTWDKVVPRTHKLPAWFQTCNYQTDKSHENEEEAELPPPPPPLWLLWYFLFSYQHCVTLWWRLRNTAKHVRQRKTSK